MKYRKLTESGDYSFGNNKQDYITDKYAVAQAIKTKILLFYGEWWEDLGLGIPMFQSILGQTKPSLISNSLQLLVSERIKDVPFIRTVDIVNVSIYNRTIRMEIKVTTTGGESVEVEVEV